MNKKGFNLTLTLSVIVIISLLLLMVFAPVFKGTKDRLASVIGLGSGNKYCEISKTNLGDFSKNLQAKLHDNTAALSYYEYSSECFGPEQVIMEEEEKQKFFCTDNPNLSNSDDNVKKYCS